jgi:DNA-binding transcriptional regulator YiaG
MGRVGKRRRPRWRTDGWDPEKIEALREHLGATQEELAQRMGTRQQTISEWETGVYRPRGMSERLLHMVAEEAGFAYEAGSEDGERDDSAPG